MNTLKFKALFIKIAVVVFTRAVLIYLLATIPAAAASPAMYLVSAGLALSFGWLAGGLFCLFFILVARSPWSCRSKQILLYVSVAAAVGVAFQAMEITGAEAQIWQSGPFLLFPATAVLSGWISLVIGNGRIRSVLLPDESGLATGNSSGLYQDLV